MSQFKMLSHGVVREILKWMNLMEIGTISISLMDM